MVVMTIPAADPKAVLCKAVFRAQEFLGLTNDDLGRVLGLDRTTVNRKKSRGEFDPEGKSGELALMLIRIYRSLYALMGENPGAIQHWMKTENRHLNGTPKDLVKRVEGLTRVTQYLDAMRGRV